MARERGRSDGEPGEPSRSTRIGPISGMRCGAELRVREAWSEWSDVRRRGTLRVAGEARRGGVRAVGAAEARGDGRVRQRGALALPDSSTVSSRKKKNTGSEIKSKSMTKDSVAVSAGCPGRNAVWRMFHNVTLHEILQSLLEKQNLPGQFLQFSNIVCAQLQQTTGETKFKYFRNEISKANQENFVIHTEYT